MGRKEWLVSYVGQNGNQLIRFRITTAKLKQSFDIVMKYIDFFNKNPRYALEEATTYNYMERVSHVNVVTINAGEDSDVPSCYNFREESGLWATRYGYYLRTRPDSPYQLEFDYGRTLPSLLKDFNSQWYTRHYIQRDLSEAQRRKELDTNGSI